MLVSNARQNKDGAVSEIFNAYRLLTDHPSGKRNITIFFDFSVCTQEIDTQTDINQWNKDFIQFFIAKDCAYHMHYPNEGRTNYKVTPWVQKSFFL